MAREAANQKKRSFWTDEEDARLVQLVDIHGIHNWPDVANALQGRDSKSCSLRWRYFLAPHIIRSTDQKLSDWEVAVLVWAQREYGNKWRTIVDGYLPWRSPNDLKNYCNQYINGKRTHVITQNKLVLQNVPLQTLLAHPPPEVQERWHKIKLMREMPPTKVNERPVKKGTRGLSYIIRQAGKLQTQRVQPYSRPHTPAPLHDTSSMLMSIAPLAAAAAGGSAGCGSFTSNQQSQQRQLSGGSWGEAGAAGFCTPNPAAAYCGMSMQQAAGGMYSGGSSSSTFATTTPSRGAAADAAAGFGMQPYSSAPGMAGVQLGSSFGMNMGNSSSSMSFSSPPGHISSTSCSMGPAGSHHAFGWPAGMNMNMSLPPPHASSGMNMYMAPPQPFASAAAAAGSAAVGAATAAPAVWPLSAPPECSPPTGVSSADGSSPIRATGTPTSDMSCYTPSSLGRSMQAMNIDMGMAPGGAFNGLPAAAGSMAPAAAAAPAAAQSSMWQQFAEAADYASGNSMSSTSSTCAVEPAGYSSPTHLQQGFRAAAPVPAANGVAATPANGGYVAAVVHSLPQQLLPPGLVHHHHQQQQQQEQPRQTAYQPPLQQQQQQQQQQQVGSDAPARSSGTGAVCAGAPPATAIPAAAAAVASAMDQAAVLLEDEFEAADFAALLDFDIDGTEQQHQAGSNAGSSNNIIMAAACTQPPAPAASADASVANNPSVFAAAPHLAAAAGWCPGSPCQPPSLIDAAAAAAAAAAFAAHDNRVQLQHSDDFSLDFTSSGGCSDLDFELEMAGTGSLGGCAEAFGFAVGDIGDDLDITLLTAVSL